MKYVVILLQIYVPLKCLFMYIMYVQCTVHKWTLLASTFLVDFASSTRDTEQVS